MGANLTRPAPAQTSTRLTSALRSDEGLSLLLAGSGRAGFRHHDRNFPHGVLNPKHQNCDTMTIQLKLDELNHGAAGLGCRTGAGTATWR
jgi:hypothetical protein